jgi:hypothetical protein
MKRENELTASQEILLAASDLATQGKGEFTEWDLTVAAWKRNRNRFGCRGYEDDYPDHKRVMMEIMSREKKDSPLRRGWLEKVRTNYYRITPLGVAEAERIQEKGREPATTVRAAQPIYEAVAPYILHPVFRRFLEDSEEPRTWLGAEGFLGLTRHDAVALEDRLRSVSDAAENALRWMCETGQGFLRSGATGGKRAVLRHEVEKLPEFIRVLQTRFKVQMDAIRHRE